MRKATQLRLYLVAGFLPSFLMAMAFFVFILELVELFGNLWKYLSLNVPMAAVAKVLLLYAPTCISWALPLSLLFAVSYTLGSLYARNELVAVFGTGVSLASFTLPLIFIAAALSLAGYFWSDLVALPAYREKTSLSQKLLGQSTSLSNADVTVLAEKGAFVWHASWYDESAKSLTDVNVIERDKGGAPIMRIEAGSAKYKDGLWLFSRVRRFALDAKGQWTETDYGSYSDPTLAEDPASFRNQNLDLGQLSVADLAQRAKFQKAAGLPWTATVAERNRRMAFSFAPLVVALLSTSIGGRYRKNVLLMSLLVSLVIATAYYIFQMIAMLFARTGLVDPAIGAWSPLIVFAALSALLYRMART